MKQDCNIIDALKAICEVFGRLCDNINHEVRLEDIIVTKDFYITLNKSIDADNNTYYGIALSGDFAESVTITTFDWTNETSLDESIQMFLHNIKLSQK